MLRWISLELGVVAPADFPPILEQTGDIREVGHWVLDNAAQMLAGCCARNPSARDATAGTSRACMRPSICRLRSCSIRN
ncbi:hypothetical protein ACU4HD_43260 [Cupriavidus basilensis]